MKVRKRTLAFLAAIGGVLESGAVLVMWWASDISSWGKTPPLIRVGAPIPFLMGEPENALRFFVGWGLNVLVWATLAYALLLLAFRRQLARARTL
jgi:hypothetical protein